MGKLSNQQQRAHKGVERERKMKKIIQELSESVQQHFPRRVVALLSWGVIFILCFLLLKMWLNIRLPFVLGTWAFIMSFSIRPFMVSVPEVTALVTINLLTGELKAYETGLWFRYPWEQVKMGNYINLRLLPLGAEENYPAKDGPLMHTKWQAPYRVVNAINFIKVGREAVEGILQKAGSGVLSAYIAKHDSDKVKDNQEGVEKKLQEKFSKMELEELCGVKIPVVSLADLDYDPTVQKVLATQYVARKLKTVGEDLRKGQEEIKPKDALNSAMIIHGAVTKHVNEVEGEGGNALAALFMAMAQGGGGKKGEK